MRSSYPSRLIPCNRGSRQKKSLASLRVFAVGKFFKIKESATPTLHSVDKGHVQVLDPCKYANRKQCFREQRRLQFTHPSPLSKNRPPTTVFGGCRGYIRPPPVGGCEMRSVQRGGFQFLLSELGQFDQEVHGPVQLPVNGRAAPSGSQKGDDCVNTLTSNTGSHFCGHIFVVLCGRCRGGIFVRGQTLRNLAMTD